MAEATGDRSDTTAGVARYGLAVVAVAAAMGLRLTLTSIGDAVIATDADGRITLSKPVNAQEMED